MKTTMQFKINNLISGGIITNYFCTSRCQHCLYRCSPNLPKKYINHKILQHNLDIISKKGRPSIHIGGGEPFLGKEKLIKVVDIITHSDLYLEYAETNSSWFKTKEQAQKFLLQLKSKGLNTILVSISPFHTEYIPFYKVLGVIETAKECNINIFPWIESFMPDILHFNIQKTHPLKKFTEKFGASYLKEITSRYWIHPGGRAVNFLTKTYPLKSIKEIFLEPNCEKELLNTHHFHVDLYGNYIPGLCAGLSIKIEHILHKIDEQKYPLLTLLFFKGIKGLFDMVSKEFGYVPKNNKYLNKCHLCLEIRDFLKKEKNINFLELNPPEFYLKDAD